MKKGTQRHRLVGRVYAASALVINGTALFIYDLTGRVNVFHILAIVNLTSLFFGLTALWRWRRTRALADLRQHRVRMSMNYLGLLMAFASELLLNPYFQLMPAADRAHFWPLVGLLNVTMFVTGYLVIRRAARIYMGPLVQPA